MLQRCACGGSPGADGGECAACRNKRLSVQRQAANGAELTAVPPMVHDVLRSPGQPLEAATRASMEPRFGYDFSRVRVHTDARAAESARAVHALAYTVGRDVVFGAGQYVPGTSAGRRLLAHELTHVVQQTAGPMELGRSVTSIGSESAIEARAMSQPGDASEVEAETLAARIDSSTIFAPRLRSPGILHRAMRKGCIAPSFVVDAATASAFGTIAEAIIEADYLTTKGGTPFADVFLDNPMGPLSYVAFLAAHHPSLNVPSLAIQIGLSGGVLVPDILDTRGTPPEFYEVKPDSPDGRLAGRGKLAAIDAFMSFNSLPYVRGTTYTPKSPLPIPIPPAVLAAAIGLPAAICGVPVVTLEAKRAASGLLLYQVCIEADLDCYLKVLTLEALVALIIVAIIVFWPVLAPAFAPALAGGAAVTAAVGAAAAPSGQIPSAGEAVASDQAAPTGEVVESSNGSAAGAGAPA
jgi:hypothetical protein